MTECTDTPLSELVGKVGSSNFHQSQEGSREREHREAGARGRTGEQGPEGCVAGPRPPHTASQEHPAQPRLARRQCQEELTWFKPRR